ncbi:TraR/DksA C4-type zinc finger protein [Pseudolysinimonas kribbensis]|uniref:TraR/DksA family transcriptional regulator n=1 Tax=Pseudolysinimonas kribbensis TaxID=433641 RepID=UPI0031D91B2E
MDAETARALMARRRDDIRGRLDEVDRRLAAVREARGDWTDEEHDPEGFALTHEWSQAEGARVRLGATLRELERAGDRVSEGSYGRCAVCDAEIPTAQLELQPERTACVACVDRRRR